MLDYYHASQHLHEAMEFIYGPSSPKVRKQHEIHRRILRDDPAGITKVLNHLQYKAKHKIKDAKGLSFKSDVSELDNAGNMMAAKRY